MAAIGDRNHRGDHFMLMPFERKIRRHERAEGAERVEENIRKKRVARHDARHLAVIHGMDRRCVFNGIELALRFDGVLDAGVFFHWNSFDPGHEEGSLSWDGSWRPGRSDAALLQGTLHDLRKPSTLIFATGRGGWQIGRASCRER